MHPKQICLGQITKGCVNSKVEGNWEETHPLMKEWKAEGKDLLLNTMKKVKESMWTPGAACRA